MAYAMQMLSMYSEFLILEEKREFTDTDSAERDIIYTY